MNRSYKTVRLVFVLAVLVFASGHIAWEQQAEAKRHGALWRLFHRKQAKRSKQIRRNARAGDRRERLVGLSLRLRHPFSRIEPEVYLRDKRGHRLVDRKSGEARRFDFAVITPTGRVKKLVEVTSKTADKHAQQAKANRILKRQNVFIRDRAGRNLHRVKPRRITGTQISTRRLR